GLATAKDVSAAKNDFAKAEADVKRAVQVSQIYGARGNAVQSITAPISGFVVEKNVTDKMQYQATGAQPFFVISNLDEVWVMASVFESDIEKIKPGYDADVNVVAFKDKKFHGKVDRIFNILDPQSRVMKVRIRIPNRDFALKPEMFAQIRIKYDDASQLMPAIPSQAVIFDKDKSFVMVYHDKCHIETREVQVLQTSGDVTYIKSGLSDGEKVISQYQLLVYDALND
ncbi:MAG: efflux RND transporter periplasmic adaptor subunit, partial [Flavisolibacter sp.]